MPNIGHVLKDEIKRLARKEINSAMVTLRKANAALKKGVSDHKQRIAALEKENKKLQQLLAKQAGGALVQPAEAVQTAIMTGKGIKSLRKRLHITQGELAKLIGSSLQIVPRWEKTRGRIKIRTAKFISAIQKLKSMKKAEVHALLGKQGAQKKPSGGKGTKKNIGLSNITAGMIKAVRRKRSISQAKLAEVLGVSNQIVSKWESKTGRLSFKSRRTEDKIKAFLRGSSKKR